MITYLPKPKNFILQWHITERCNWHCKHCYQSDDYIKQELSTEQLFDILKQYVSIVKHFNLPCEHAMINITGGEPFIRKDFFEFAEKLGSHSNLLKWGMLSNGSFITKEVAEKLKSLNISHYQVSLEGAEKTNDKIRGKNTFKQVLNSIRILVSTGILVDVSLTLTKQNMNDIPELVKILDELGVYRLGTRRIIPYGRGSSMSDDLLAPEELRKFYLDMVGINKRLIRKHSKLRVGPGCESGIFNDELLFRDKRYCGIVDGRIIIVMPNGDVLPCRRLPMVIGNVLKQSLFEIYYSSNKLWEMRNLNNAHVFCQNCKNFNQCFGGAKCINYCYANKIFIPDVQCWKFNKKLEKPETFYRFKEDIKKELKLNCVLTCPKKLNN